MKLKLLHSLWETWQIHLHHYVTHLWQTVFLQSKEISQAKEETAWQKGISHNSHLPVVSEAVRKTDSVEHFDHVDRLNGASQEFT